MSKSHVNSVMLLVEFARAVCALCSVITQLGLWIAPGDPEIVFKRLSLCIFRVIIQSPQISKGIYDPTEK